MNLKDLPESTVKLVSSFPKEHAGKILKLALASLQPQRQNLIKPIEKLAIERNIPMENLYEILSVYIGIIRLFVHSTDKDFVATLTDLGFQNDFMASLPFVDNRKELEDTFFVPNYDNFRNVSSMKWRIDISLLNSALTTKTPPSVILSISLKNGKSYTIELNPKAFHLLRFNVARLLREMKCLQLN
ncbi:hypothetical protein HUJ04_012685 [Dendroctonus ponderosae]